MSIRPNQQRYVDRLNELIVEGQSVAALERQDNGFTYIREKAPLNAWLMKVANIVTAVFGTSSPQVLKYQALSKKHPSFEHSYEVLSLVGLLQGALSDLENGFLIGQEFLVAGEVFDSVLQQAKDLNKAGYKDPAAILGRVVLEDALRRLANEASIDSTLKASVLNEELKKAGRYAQPQWRLIQAWLDTGNAAAHGRFNDYSQDDVVKLLDDIERFLATYFITT